MPMRFRLLFSILLLTSQYNIAQDCSSAGFGCCDVSQRGQTFLSTDNPGDDQSYLGNTVAINGLGNVMAISDSGYGNDEEGRVRVFEYLDNEWIQVGQDLTGYSFNDDFGASIQLNEEGDILAVGDEGAGGPGYARIYHYNGADWIQLGQSITPGRSLDLNNEGNRIACVSTIDNVGLLVFDYDEPTDSWIQVGQQVPAELSSVPWPAEVDLSPSGDVLTVSALGPSSAIRVYELSGEVWMQKGESIEFTLTRNMRINEGGSALVIAGSNGVQRYVFENGWIESGSLLSPDDGLSGFPLGLDASPSLDRIIINDGASGDSNNKVYVFDWIEGAWYPRIEPLFDLSSFGYGQESVAISQFGDVFVVGHPFFDSGEGQATVWELSCPTPGCMDLNACNYTPQANQDDGSCIYPECYYDCNGECINDTNSNGICDELEPPYNPDSDGDQLITSTDLLSLIPLYGLPYMAACPQGAQEPEAVYNPDYDDDATIAVPDLLAILPLFGQQYIADLCPQCVSGCTDMEAINYDPLATNDDGSCLYSP